MKPWTTSCPAPRSPDSSSCSEVRANSVSRTAVVAASSRHGSTAAIATRLAGVLAKHLSDQWTVEQVDPSELERFDDADAVVLGSAVYLGHWMHPAAKALGHVKDAPLLDLWLFSTGPVSDQPSENDRVIKADKMVETGCAVEHMVFAGSLDVSSLGRWERIVIRAVHAVSGDRRDWEAIDAWGESIATQLTHAVADSDPQP